jgi:nucleoid-associated protein YgaU
MQTGVRIDGALPVQGAPGPFQSAPAVQSTRQHVVAPGQTLWLISRALYGSGIHYRRLHRLNKARIGNPDRIYPGQVLLVPDIETDENAPPAADGR